jgi:hypothetical protein
MKDHLYEREIFLFFLRILIKAEFYEAIMNPIVVSSQNEHNYENQRKSLGIELCEYYCLGLYKNVK